MFKKVFFGLFVYALLFNSLNTKADTITVYTLYLGAAEVANTSELQSADTVLLDLTSFLQSDSFFASKISCVDLGDTFKKISLVSPDSMIVFSDSAVGDAHGRKSPALGLPSASVLTSFPIWLVVFELDGKNAERMRVVWYLAFE